MSGDADRQLLINNQLRARVARLERLLSQYGLPVPPGDDGAFEAPAPHLSFPELDFSEPKRKPPRAVAVRSAIEEFPHITAAVLRLWGKDGFEEYLAKLIVDERGNRKGFNMDAMEELLFLARVTRQRKAFFGSETGDQPGNPWKGLREATGRTAGGR
ncbi:MAG: hypothetical protein WCJ69_02035 [Betaproteobacteria bacterium]|jgi:hypothetical protein